ncbi:MAG: B12-binding domain-containing radical SAM protein [Saprospiraceae bacterium]|nr:B12-binding domain-containing radical SAM protein [Saprospiraceae bacterium]
MKILLSHGYFLNEDPKELKIMRPYPPLGILSISAFLETHGFENHVYDTTFSNYGAWKNYVKIQKPEILGLYTNLMTKIRIIEMIKWIKLVLPETCIVLGGPDTTYNTERYLLTGADFIVIGEGELTVLELVQSLTGNVSQKPDNIAGIAWLDSTGLLQRTMGRAKLKDISQLPIPNRKSIDLNLYLKSWQRHHGQASISVSTQRGCPYTCKWCSTAVYGQSYRRRSAQHVVIELQSLVDDYGINQFWFVDDVFTISHKWLTSFEEELVDSGLTIRFECISRADRLNEDVIKQLKRLGCFRVWIGAESGSQNVIDLMDRRVDVQYVSEMIHLTKKNEMEAGTFIMLGYPGETEADIRETINYLKSAHPDQFTITVAYPIQGTSLHSQVVDIPLDQQAWETQTDREQDFPRTFRRRYYDHAVRYVVNQVEAHRISSSLSYQWWWLQLKSILALAGMQWQKIRR